MVEFNPGAMLLVYWMVGSFPFSSYIPWWERTMFEETVTNPDLDQRLAECKE